MDLTGAKALPQLLCRAACPILETSDSQPAPVSLFASCSRALSALTRDRLTLVPAIALCRSSLHLQSATAADRLGLVAQATEARDLDIWEDIPAMCLLQGTVAPDGFSNNQIRHARRGRLPSTVTRTLRAHPPLSCTMSSATTAPALRWLLTKAASGKQTSSR